VISGLARYAREAQDAEAFGFAKALYQSALRRVREGDFATLPYPIPPGRRVHGIPMIFTNTAAELFYATASLDPGYATELKAHLSLSVTDILSHFTDGNHVLREVIGVDNHPCPGMLGQHINPGHALESLWFMAEASDILGVDIWDAPLAAIALYTLEAGWDREFGGILHFCHVEGGAPRGSVAGDENEAMLAQLTGGWGDKLWWVHSEALYATLLFYARTQDPRFLDWHEKIMDYTFRHFPNPDKEVGEWIQILDREGNPQEKVVALPVKDPYHITRNLIQIIELLGGMQAL